LVGKKAVAAESVGFESQLELLDAMLALATPYKPVVE
jgi:hypothetical protein